MAGGDLEYFATLNDAQFQAAMKRLDRTITAEQAKLDRGFVGGQFEKSVLRVSNLGKAIGAGVGGGLALGAKMVKDFADKNAYAGDQIRGVETAWVSLTDRLARDMAAGVMADSGGIGGVIRSIDQWLQSAAEEIGYELKTGFGFGEGSDDYADSGVLKEQQKQNKTLDDRKRLNDELLRLDVESTRVSGSELAVAMADRERRIAAIREKYAKDFPDVGDPVANQMRAAAMDKAIQIEDARIRQIAAKSANERRDQQRDAANTRKERERDRDAMFLGLDFEMQAIDAKRLRMAGREKEAELAEITLKYAERMAEVERDTTLTIDERAAARERLMGLAEQEASLVGAERRQLGANVLDAGLGGNRAVAGITFGVGGGGGNELLTVQRQSRDILRQIQTTLQRGGVPTFN